MSAHTCPFRQLRRHFPRQAGTAFLYEPFLYFCSYPFRRLFCASHLASHSLLQRRFAPRKVVRLLPDIRGRLAVSILIFIFNHTGRLFCVFSDRIFLFHATKKTPCEVFFVICESDSLECVVQFNAPSIFRIFIYSLYISSKAVVGIEFEVLLKCNACFSLPESYISK